MDLQYKNFDSAIATNHRITSPSPSPSPYKATLLWVLISFKLTSFSIKRCTSHGNGFQWNWRMFSIGVIVSKLQTKHYSTEYIFCSFYILKNGIYSNWLAFLNSNVWRWFKMFLYEVWSCVYFFYWILMDLYILCEFCRLWYDVVWIKWIHAIVSKYADWYGKHDKNWPNS